MIFSDIDVVFLGTSHVWNAINPLEIGDNYGLTTYNFGNTASEIPTTYWTMMDMFNTNYSTEKGMNMHLQVTPQTDGEESAEDISYYENTVSYEYCSRIIEECLSRDIEVVLIYLPYVKSQVAINEAETARKIAEEYGIKYIDFFNFNCVNLNTDMLDYSHVNLTGALKISDIIGEYLSNQTNLTDHRFDMNYSYWNDDYKQYRSKHNYSLLHWTETPDVFWIYLCQKDIKAIVHISTDDYLLFLSKFENMKNLGGEISFEMEKNISKVKIDMYYREIFLGCAEMDIENNEITFLE